MPRNTTTICIIRETILIRKSSVDVNNGLDAISPNDGNFPSYRLYTGDVICF